MDKVRFGIVGFGNQGSSYVKMFLKDQSIENGVLTALCDINPDKIAACREQYGDAIAYFSDAEEMFRSGKCDFVLIETPHFLHPSLAIKAIEAGLHVCVEKPAGVYTNQVKEMLAAADKSDRILGIMFNQRTNPIFRKMRQLIADGVIGEIKRTNWIITDWYRTQYYYDSGSWRATWAGEGGGVLYNQAPHQLDLFQWIVGMSPCRVQAFTHEGKWHDIEVEDDVTAYLEYPNGATGVFITTTGDTPGSNRFEVTGTKGKLVFEHNELTLWELDEDERRFCVESKAGFATPKARRAQVLCEGENTQHKGILNNLANAALGLEPLYADAHDALAEVQLANAMHLSGWLGKPVDMPIDGDLYYSMLSERMKHSRLKTGKDIIDPSLTHGEIKNK